jgi:Fibronectin type III domain/Calcineurin-like phosphoesterase
VTNLTNGTSYTFTVTATNGVGTGLASSASSPVIPATTPGAPTGVSAVAGNGQASVSWTAPSSDGGSPILSYTITGTPGGSASVTAPATSALVTGLTNGTSYTFTVTATNAIGSGSASSASNAVTPAGLPGAPTGVSAVAGNAQATVSWTAAAPNGSAILSYTVNDSGGGSITVTAPATSAVVTGLTNGQSYTFTVTATNGIGSGSPSSASNAVTPTAGPIPVLRRAPYLTNLSTTTATVNLATDTSTPAPVIGWDLASTGCTAPSHLVPATSVAAFSGALSGTTDIQFMASISGLSAGTAYCYRVTQGGYDLLGKAVTFTTAPPASSSAAFTFAVIGDWGAGSTDEANVFTQIAAANPAFLMTVGDNVYNSGTQTEYGDLNGGNAFAPAYLPKIGGGTPVFAAQGNHGFTGYSAYLQNFPQAAVAAASGGTYAPQSYCCAAGTSGTHTYASAWYAFTWGNARFYVLEAGWADGNGAYQGDFTDHWNGPVSGCTPCGQELTWLQGDLAAHASVPLKFAVFHYPLYADNGGQPSDTYLDGTGALEGLLAANGVDVVFNGHAHQYERNLPQISGEPLVSYVTGGGGDALGSISGCSAFDAYAIGSSSSCNAPKPTSSTQVFHYLKVTVNGGQVTVTPINELGQSFDVQTYTFGSGGGATAPGAPTNVTAVAGNGQASVSWTSPSSDGGSTITSYTVTGSPGGSATVTAPATSAIVTGLINGQSYTFTVTATNGVGTGPPSTASNAVIPVGLPGVPTGVTATAGNGQATVSWTAAASNGSTISSYTITGSPGGSATVSGSATSAVVSSLINGQSYTFTVTATNGVGTGPPSVPSNSVIPTSGPTAPGAPTNVTAVAGNGQASVSWTSPSSDGGSTITSYTVTGSPGGSATVTAPATSAIVTGLINGQSYTFTVTATNGVGTGPPSTASNAVIPVGLPGVPTGVTATAGNGQATVSWTAAASNGSTISSYTITGSPGGSATVSGSATSAVVSSLINGQSYTFTVTATNGVGTGPPSVPSNSVIPTAATGPFTLVPTADAYVSSGAKTTNYGTSTTLEVGSSPLLHTYIMFDVQGLTASPTSATLMLWTDSAGSGSSVHSTSTAWTETGITYSNAPSYGSTVGTVTNFAAGTWISYNVTSLVTGNGAVAFAFTSASKTPILFASREDTVHAPQLIIAP